jgi:hypothetical protein
MPYFAASNTNNMYLFQPQRILALLLISSFASCNYVPNTQKENYQAQDDAIQNIITPKTPEAEEPKKPFTGLHEAHHPNGKVKSAIHYVEGIQHGTATEYYDDGTIAKEVNYVDGQLQGETKMFDRQGRLMKSLHYSNGKKNGTQTRYFKSGKPKSQMTYTLDIPNNDLWEKDAKGNINRDFGKLNFQVARAANSSELFYIQVQLSPQVRNLDLYAFSSTTKHVDGIKRENLMTQSALPINVAKGERIQGSIHVVAVYETAMNNEAVVFGSYDFDIAN